MENTIDKQQMDSAKALADTNMKISETKALLIKLEETETEYLVEREKKAMERIGKMLEDSRNIIAETNANYNEVQRFNDTVRLFSAFLCKAYENLGETIRLFDEKNIALDAAIELHDAQIEEQKRRLLVNRTKIVNDKRAIQDAAKRLENDNRKLQSDRGALERAINRLKNNQI